MDVDNPVRWQCGLVALLPRLRRFARVLTRDRTAADDLVQELLLRALAATSHPEDSQHLAPWLFTILRHAHVSSLRRGQRSPLVHAPNAAEPAVSGGQEERRDLAELSVAFEALPGSQREVLWLAVVEGLDYERIALVQHVPIGTVRSRLARARATLRRRLQGVAV